MTATTETVHYAPGDRPLCGSESITAAYTDDPALVAEDLDENNEHWANCLQEISAQNGVEWRLSSFERGPETSCGPCLYHAR